MWDHMYRYDGSWGGGWLGGPYMLIFLIVVIVGVVLLVWAVNSGKGLGRGERNSALEILRERYARGEISLEEFEERKRHLEG